jgi:hypothetical protein
MLSEAVTGHAGISEPTLHLQPSMVKKPLSEGELSGCDEKAGVGSFPLGYPERNAFSPLRKPRGAGLRKRNTMLYNFIMGMVRGCDGGWLCNKRT